MAWHEQRRKITISKGEKVTWHAFALALAMLCVGILLKACGIWGGF